MKTPLIRLSTRMALVIALMLLSLAATAGGSEPTVTIFSAGIGSGSGPNGIAAGPEGDMYFTEYHGEKIGRITQAGVITELPTEGQAQLSPGAHPAGIVAGPDGNMWFSEFETGKIGQLDPASGELLGEYAIPNGAAAGPDGIVSGPEGDLWFAEQGEGEIGRVNPASHEITQYLVHQHTSNAFEPSNLVTGAEGDLWFTLTGTGQIGRLVPGEAEGGTDKGVTLYDLPAGTTSAPEGIALGPEGDLYVAEFKAAKIARVAPGEVEAQTSKGIVEYSAGGFPLLATATKGGSIWFSDNSAQQLIRLDPAEPTEPTFIGAAAGVSGDTTGLAEDGDGHVWFTQFQAPEAIGRVTLQPHGGVEQPIGPIVNPVKLEPTPAPTPKLEVISSSPKVPPIFNAGGSSGNGSPIVGYKVKVLAGGETSQIECGTKTPEAAPQFTKAISGTATLTVTDADGQSASSTINFTNPVPLPVLAHPPGKAHSAEVTGREPVQIPIVPDYKCLPAGGEAEAAAKAAEAPSTDCETVAGILRIAGCGLKKVEGLCSLPAAERSIVERHLLPGAVAKKIVGCEGAKKAFFASRYAARSATTLSGSVKAAETLLSSLQDSFYVSSQPLLVNGVTVSPEKGTALAVAVGGLLSTSFAKQYGAYLVSSGAHESLGDFPLQGGKLNLDVSNLGAAEAQFASFNLKSPITYGRFSQLAAAVAFESQGGVPSLPIEGGFNATFIAGGKTRFGINLELKPLFSDPLDDAPFTGATSFTTSNDHGPELQTLDIDVPDLNIGLVDLSNLKLHWVAATNIASGSFAVDIDGAGGAIGGTLAFKGKILTGGSIFYQADEGNGLALIGPIYLIGLSDAITIWQQDIPGSKATFDGTSDISVGPAISNTGCGVAQVHGDTLWNIYPGPFEISSVSTLEIFCLPLQQSYFSVNENGYVELGGDVQWEVPDFFTVKANLDGQAYLDLKQPGDSDIQLDGSATGTFDLPDPLGNTTVSAEAVISNLGAGICTELSFLGHDFHPGLTESFTPPPLTPDEFLSKLSLYGEGCDLSPFQPLGKGGPPGGGGTAAGVHAHSASSSFTVAKSSPNTAIALQGQGGAPSVSLTGPSGKTIDTAADALSATDLVLRQPTTNTTLVEISSAAAGAWTLTPDPGSPPLSKASISHELPKPRIKASVTGHGSSRLLHYRITAQPGMKVTFAESGTHGGQRLGSARGRIGTIRFTPSDARSGTRKIIAILTQNGMPRPSVVVARFNASPPRPGRAHSIHVKAIKGGLLVSFRPPPLASFSIVAVSLGGGRSVLLSTAPGGHSVLIPEVKPGTKVKRITVTGFHNGVRGPAVRAR